MIRILALALLLALAGCGTTDNGCPTWFVFYGCGT